MYLTGFYQVGRRKKKKKKAVDPLDGKATLAGLPIFWVLPIDLCHCCNQVAVGSQRKESTGNPEDWRATLAGLPISWVPRSSCCSVVVCSLTSSAY